MSHTPNIQPAGNTHSDFSEVLTMIRTTRDNVLCVANMALIDLYWKLGEYISLINLPMPSGAIVWLSSWQYLNALDIKGFSKKNL